MSSPLRATLGDRYRLDALLHEGRTGTVYRAWDTRLRRQVAIRVLRQDGSLTEWERRSFLDDVRALARFNHPYVVTVHDGAISGGEPYLVMEWLPGKSLHERLAEGPLPVGESLAIAQGLAGALVAARANGIHDLNLAPKNVLFDGDKRAKIAQFRVGSEGMQTAPHDAVGTGTAYVPPELLAGQHAGERTDVYQLALLLYQMLAGSEALRDSGSGQIPVPAHIKNREVPEAVGHAISRALSPNPEERFPTLSAFSSVLREARRPGEARPVAPTAATVRRPSIPRARMETPLLQRERPRPGIAERLATLIPLLLLALILFVGYGAFSRWNETRTSGPAMPTLEAGQVLPTEIAPTSGSSPAAPTNTGAAEATETGPFLDVVTPTPGPEVVTDSTEVGTATPESERPTPPPPGEEDELYDVSVPSFSLFTAVIEDMAQDIDLDLYLYDAEGNELRRSTNPGNEREEIELELPAGSYELRVHFIQGNENSPHRVNWSWVPLAPDGGAQ